MCKQNKPFSLSKLLLVITAVESPKIATQQQQQQQKRQQQQPPHMLLAPQI